MVDYAFYRTVYGGSLENASFLFFADRAEREIRAACYGRLDGVTELTEFQKDAVKRAICYETDYLAAYGEALSAPVGSMSIGSTSLSFQTDGGGKMKRISSDAAQLLEWSGLTCRVIR